MPSRAERALAAQTVAATGRSREAAADQHAHGWSAQRGRYSKYCACSARRLTNACWVWVKTIWRAKV